jgi:hypothetical protein
MMPYQRYEFNEAVAWAAGTVATPVAAAVYDARKISLNHEVVNMVESDARIGQYFPGQPLPAGRHSVLDFEAFIRGQHTADVPAPEGALLRACGFQETASGTTPSVVYKYTLGNPHVATSTLPGATDPCLDPIDLVVNHDSLSYTLDNCVGNVVLNFTAGQLPTYAFKFRGNCASEASGSTAGYAEAVMSVTGTYVQGDMPTPVQNSGPTLLVNTSTKTLTGVKSIEFDAGNVINPRERMGGTFGYGQAIVTGYKPTLTMVIESDLLATIDPFTDCVAGNKWTVGWVHNSGGGLGNVITGSFIGAISGPPDPGYVNGQLYYTIKLAQYKGAALPYFAWS